MDSVWWETKLAAALTGEKAVGIACL